MPGDALFGIVGELRLRQELFRATGGSHAAAIFTPEGGIVAFAEDIARHNALDKALGTRLLAGAPLMGVGAALWGRLCFDWAAKAARAGVELLVAVSAPSSMAVEAAEQWNVTLCGFVRGGDSDPGRANIYTHPGRIKAN